MKRTLQGSKQKLPNMNELNNAAKNIDPSILGSVQEVVGRCEGKSEAELLSELMAAKNSGMIDPRELSSVASRISPMLSAQQQQRLESILRQLK